MVRERSVAVADNVDPAGAGDEMDEAGMLVGENIRRLRKARGMTLEAMSELTGLRSEERRVGKECRL